MYSKSSIRDSADLSIVQLVKIDHCTVENQIIKKIYLDFCFSKTIRKYNLGLSYFPTPVALIPPFFYFFMSETMNLIIRNRLKYFICKELSVCYPLTHTSSHLNSIFKGKLD